MPSSFTPEQIAQILEEFFRTVGTRQYIGPRLVPIFGRKGEESIEWDGGASPYEPLTVVLYQGNSYVSRQYVPTGVAITNDAYWAQTGNYNAQIEQYRQEVSQFDTRITTNADDIDALESAVDTIEGIIPSSDFSAQNTVKDYIGNARVEYGETANPIYYGADPTGQNDSAQAINDCIEANKGGWIWFSPGTYKIGSTIDTPHVAEERVSIDFNGARLVASTNLEYMLGIGKLNPQESGAAGAIRTYFKNGILDAGSTETHYGIICQDYYKDAVVSQCNILGFRCGVSVGTDGYSSPSDFNMFDCYIYYPEIQDADGIGIDIWGSDNKFADMRIYGFHTGVKSRRNGQWFDNIHFLPKYQYGSGYTVLNESAAVEFLGGVIHLSRIYFDTYETAIRVSNSGGIIDVDGCYLYSYITPAINTLLDFSALEVYNGFCSITNTTIWAALHPQGYNESVKLPANPTTLLDSIQVDASCSYRNNGSMISADILTMGYAKENELPSLIKIGTTIPADTWIPIATFVGYNQYIHNASVRIVRHTSTDVQDFKVYVHHTSSNDAFTAYVDSNTYSTAKFGYARTVINGIIYITIYLMLTAQGAMYLNCIPDSYLGCVPVLPTNYISQYNHVSPNTLTYTEQVPTNASAITEITDIINA